MENISGRTVERIPDNGKIIICMVKAPIHGPMVGDMKASTKWIRSMAMVFTTGLTAVYIKAIGLMENSMVKVNISSRLVK